MNNGQTHRNLFTRPIVFFFLLALIIAATVIVIEVMQRRKALVRPHSANLNAPLVERIKTPFPREIRDASGAKLIIKEKPQRIVSQTLATNEILLAICDPQRIAALHTIVDDAKYSPVTEEAKRVKGRVSTDAEQVLQLKPDLIFISSYSKAEFVDLLKAANAPAFRFSDFDRIEDIKTNIRLIGFAIGEDEKAESLVVQMERDIENIKARIPKGGPQPRVMSFGLSGDTAGSNTLFDDILKTLGAVNVSAQNGIVGYTNVSREQLTKWNPDVIVTGADKNAIEEKRRALLNDPAVATTNAGKNKRIIVIPNQFYLSVTHHQIKAIEQLAQELYQTK
jgi:iron complex transport system substrate-binding protein